VLDAIDHLKTTAAFDPPKTRIITTSGGRPLAELLLRIFHDAHWPIEVNDDDSTELFPAKTDDAVGILFRHRKKGPAGSYFMHLLAVPNALRGAGLQYAEQEFPDNDNYNFFQLEIGNPTHV
jgi:hypothetical protein